MLAFCAVCPLTFSLCFVPIAAGDDFSAADWAERASRAVGYRTAAHTSPTQGKGPLQHCTHAQFITNVICRG